MSEIIETKEEKEVKRSGNNRIAYEKYIGKIFNLRDGSSVIVEKYVRQDEIYVRFLDSNTPENYLHKCTLSSIKLGHLLNPYGGERYVWKKICGVGINNANYHTQWKEGGVRKICPFYKCWRHMIERCYSKKVLSRCPSYSGCSVDPSWHYFMTFKAWMETQDWEGKQLDKDLKVKGNKVYGPDTCYFIPSNVNTFLTENKLNNTGLPVGVVLWGGRYKAQISNLGRGRLTFGNYLTESEAAEAYGKKKVELANELADQQTDPIISEMLRRYYLLEYTGSTGQL